MHLKQTGVEMLFITTTCMANDSGQRMVSNYKLAGADTAPIHTTSMRYARRPQQQRATSQAGVIFSIAYCPHEVVHVLACMRHYASYPHRVSRPMP